jgi:aerobic carbon-monoxide dehydrogenase medium subunit
VLRSFALHRPSTVEEASQLLAGLDEAAAYAGGTELLLLMKTGLARPRHLVDVKRVAGLDAIVDGPRLTLGAAVTHRRVERSEIVRARCPLVAAVAHHVANVRVRNVGTVGGNLAFADPHSDLATLFLTLDATVALGSARERRELPLADFVRGPWETARAADELLTAVHLTPWPAASAGAYVKFGLYERPTLGVAVRLDMADGNGTRARIARGRVAIGCVSPRPVRVPASERVLAGVALDALDDVAAEASARAAAAVEPDDDLHGSADYKREMVSVFVRRALRVAADRARGLAPDVRFPHAVVA